MTRENLVIESGRTPLSEEESGSPNVMIGDIKTNNSFNIKYAMNQQEMMRRRKLEETFLLGMTSLSSGGDPSKPIIGGATIGGPYKLMDPASPKSASPNQPFNRSGYIHKLKV